MNINFKFLLLGTSLSLVPTITQAQCVATTDCATLGYTEKSCPDGKGIRCPFGTTFACCSDNCVKNGFKYECKGTGYKSGSGQACNNKYTSCTCTEGYEWKSGKCEKISEPEKAILGQCTGYAKNCKIADILNSDGTCSNDKVSGKTPIGVVVYIGGNNCGQALALKDLGRMYWSTEYVDIPDLPNYVDVTEAEKDFDSCGNTQKIIKQGDSNTYPAAWAAVNYAPSSVPATKGKWCLPAAGVARSMMDNYSAINSGLSKAGGESLPTLSNHDHWNWSSSENSLNTAYGWCYACDGLDYDYKGYSDYRDSHYVRPVIAF